MSGALRTPKAHLQGIRVPQDKIPPIQNVLSDAERLPDLLQQGPGEIGLINMQLGGKRVVLSEPLAYNSMLPNLFKYSYFVRVEDVLEDILEECIWALRMFIRGLEESTEEQLRTIGHILAHQESKSAKYFMLGNARQKLCHYLMSPNIDRPDEAIPFLKASLAADIDKLGTEEKVWKANLGLFGTLGHAQALAGIHGDDTKAMLQRVLRQIPSSGISGAEHLSLLVEIRTSLAAVYRMRGEIDEAKAEEEWCVKWFRKNPRAIADAKIAQWLMRPHLPRSPIVDALGGDKWLTARKTSFKADNARAKQCRACAAREPEKKLFQCAQCKHIYYCSRECQKKNWPLHKASCKEMAASLKRVEELKKTDIDAALRGAEWIHWRDGSHDANTAALINALQLQRDPTRGRTHIVFRKVEYVPHVSKDIRYRFRVAQCGVFRIRDVLGVIEAFMGLDSGEGREYIDDLLTNLKETGSASDVVPVLDLTFGEGIETWLGSSGLPAGSLRNYPYNPEWRKMFNKGDPPTPLKLTTGAKDAEHDDDELFAKLSLTDM